MSDAFISYSRIDSAFADKLLQDLEARGIPVWIDRDNIEGGAAWRAAISMAIRSCCAFILILSPRSTLSEQVSKELSVAETHDRLIIPVMIEKCDIPPGMELQLAELQWISFAEQRYEVALDRLTRVIKEALSRVCASPASGVSSSSGGDSRQTNEISSSPGAGSTSTTAAPFSGAGSGRRSTDRATVAPGSPGNRKWLLAGTAAVVVTGASVAAFQLARDRGTSAPIHEVASTETRLAPIQATPAVAATVVATDDPKPKVVPAAIAADQNSETPSRRSASSPSAPSNLQQGATRSEAQQRTATAAAEKPVVIARVDHEPQKPETVARAEPAPANSGKAESAPAQAPGPIVGNSRTLLYHFPNCPGYARISGPARTEFANAREAERAGYKLSDSCSDPSGSRPAAGIIANSRTRDYFLPHCNGYTATRPEYRVPFNSTGEAERAGYRRSDKCS